MICAIDSMVVIWGFRNPRENPEKAARTQALLNMLSDEECELMVSAISVSEVLIPIALANHGRFLAELSKHTRIAAFDARAASLAADLFNKNRNLVDQKKIERRVLKADTMIVASTFIAGARRFYSHDEQCRAIASSIMDAHDLPTHDEQMFR